MTSAEIQAEKLPPSGNIEFAHAIRWLKEIAYQLALMNERNAASDDEGVNRILRKVGVQEPIPTGWRCGVCNYGRDFSDALLTARGRGCLEDGFCPACGAEDLRIVFPQGAQIPEPKPETSTPPKESVAKRDAAGEPCEWGFHKFPSNMPDRPQSMQCENCGWTIADIKIRHQLSQGAQIQEPKPETGTPPKGN